MKTRKVVFVREQGMPAVALLEQQVVEEFLLKFFEGKLHKKTDDRSYNNPVISLNIY